MDRQADKCIHVHVHTHTNTKYIHIYILQSLRGNKQDERARMNYIIFWVQGHFNSFISSSEITK